MRPTRRPRWRAVLPAALVTALGAALLSGCSTSSADENTLVVWTLEGQPDRMAATERLAARFTQQTGTKVQLVAVDENQFSQVLMSSAAADELPDVMGALPLAGTWQLASNDLIDTKATQDVLAALGRQTFAEQALELTRDGDQQIAIPSDGWAELLIYRKDLFAKAGLPKPDTYQNILQAARKLHKPGMTGMSMPTSADDAATGQAFETLALANGCELVNNRGDVRLDSPQCKEAFRMVSKLANKYSAPGAQDLDSTRATYFAGRSAMIMWSTHLLDELGGLRDDAVPSCRQCKDDTTFLAQNSGFVSGIKGPDGAAPTQFGELTSWTIQVGAKQRAAKRFVQYMMGEQAYLKWLGLAPEGKLPVRQGTVDDPDKFTEGWERLSAGVDTKKRLDKLYPAAIVRELRDVAGDLNRWAISQGQGGLMGTILGERPVPKAVNSLTTGSDPGETAEDAAADVRSIQSSLN